MVKADRTDLSPEEKAARRLLSRHGLKVPIEVEQLALSYADLEEDDIPIPIDGIVVHHPGRRSRPLIVLNRLRHTTEARRRFTLAHELGHLKIGWHHPGTIVCDIENGRSGIRAEHSMFETEANKFASELLMPSDWVIHEIGRHGNIKNLHLAIKSGAEVSHSAARIKLIKCLGPGYVCVEEDRQGAAFRLSASGYALLNWIATPDEQRDLSILRSRLDKFAIDGCVIPNGWTTIRWWRLDPSAGHNEIVDVRHSKEIFDSMLRECGLEDQQFLRRSVSGKIGAANNSRVASDSASLLDALRARFERPDVWGDAHLALLRGHPDFDVFLQKKSDELIERRRAKRTSNSPPRAHR